jgi:hypothetical protein
VKIEFAAKILPVHLRPGGQDPFERLYGIASARLHGDSDVALQLNPGIANVYFQSLSGI